MRCRSVRNRPQMRGARAARAQAGSSGTKEPVDGVRGNYTVHAPSAAFHGEYTAAQLACRECQSAGKAEEMRVVTPISNGATARNAPTPRLHRANRIKRAQCGTAQNSASAYNGYRHSNTDERHAPAVQYVMANA